MWRSIARCAFARQSSRCWWCWCLGWWWRVCLARFGAGGRLGGVAASGGWSGFRRWLAHGLASGPRAARVAASKAFAVFQEMLFVMTGPETATPSAASATVEPKVAPPPGRRLIIGAMVFAAALVIAYWVVWFGVDRNLVAASHADYYYHFQTAM